MARELCAWAINRRGKNSVRNLRYGPLILNDKKNFKNFKIALLIHMYSNYDANAENLILNEQSIRLCWFISRL